MIHWQPADPDPVLQPADVHVWRLPAGAPAEALAWLDAGERGRLEAMSDAAGRDRLLATRAGLRQVLAAYLRCPPAEVSLHIEAGGKPRTPGGPEFNLSHSGELALLAVAPRQVGIDVERRRPVPRALAIARRVLDGDTVAHLAALDGEPLNAAFLAAWTAMEARQKCLGQGVFGAQVGNAEVGSLAFEPDAAHLAHLAWEHPALAPRVHWFDASS